MKIVFVSKSLNFPKCFNNPWINYKINGPRFSFSKASLLSSTSYLGTQITLCVKIVTVFKPKGNSFFNLQLQVVLGVVAAE